MHAYLSISDSTETQRRERTYNYLPHDLGQTIAQGPICSMLNFTISSANTGINLIDNPIVIIYLHFRRLLLEAFLDRKIKSVHTPGFTGQLWRYFDQLKVESNSEF